jgi:hypothetical protein
MPSTGLRHSPTTQPDRVAHGVSAASRAFIMRASNLLGIAIYQTSRHFLATWGLIGNRIAPKNVFRQDCTPNPPAEGRFSLKIFLAVLLAAILIPAAAMAQEAPTPIPTNDELPTPTPAPTPLPMVNGHRYNPDNDTVYQDCFSNEEAHYGDIPDQPGHLRVFARSNVVECVFKKNDWLGSIYAGTPMLNVPVYTGRIKDSQTVWDVLGKGRLPYMLAVSYWRLGNKQQARLFIHEAYSRSIHDNCDLVNFTCHDIFNAFAVMDPTNAASVKQTLLANEHHANQTYLDAHEVGMSADQKKVYETEKGEPCHKSAFDTASVHEETWWFCDDNGHYTRAYTFYNGRLHSVYSP